jgi:histidinol-phosphate/aromatic aminotransferase/cobyric acid decarboxylase-like protein/choline kinase
LFINHDKIAENEQAFMGRAMQAVILAAGMGNRLGKYTKDNTKCMLPINGRTLAERALDALSEAGITKCIIVVGYKKENVIAALGARHKNIAITYISNDIYDKTNNIYSLSLAKDYLVQDDTLLLESDLIFEPKLVKDMLAFPEPTIAAVAPYEGWMDGTVVELAANNVISAFIPKKFFNYQKKETYYKTVNIYKFSQAFLRDTYVPFLEAYSRAMGNNEYYEEVLRVITTLDKNELKAFILTGQKWYEIDDAQDKAIAETIFSNTGAEKLRRIQASYGGYWRYPEMLDFCYLVNPYFPPERMQNEMKAYFSDLLSQYPSGLNTQNLLAAKMYNLEQDCILAGNGAAELIRALAPVVKGTLGISYPTFNEYAESFVLCDVVPFVPKDFSYTKDDLIELSKKCDTILLINPDNPSGNYISHADVIALAAHLKKLHKNLIVDESFIDFVDAESAPSFLTQAILDEYPNLVVIKSLSKSYGVPGIRLGVLASGNRELIQQVRKNIPIWNINSFGEYFLQIIGKYQKDYRAACALIATERARFKAKLEETSLLRVYPSQANYFLCRLKTGSAAALACDLLASGDIFIKDLSGKKGIPDNSFIRLAIRNSHDNDILAERLKTGSAFGRHPPPS